MATGRTTTFIIIAVCVCVAQYRSDTENRHHNPDVGTVL